MVRIDSFKYGEVTVKGKTYYSDVVVFVSDPKEVPKDVVCFVTALQAAGIAARAWRLEAFMKEPYDDTRDLHIHVGDSGK